MSRLRWPDSTNSVSDVPGTIHTSAASEAAAVILGSTGFTLLMTYPLVRQSGECAPERSGRPPAQHLDPGPTIRPEKDGVSES